jgi:hypothetical protein
MENLYHSKEDLAVLTQPHVNPCISLYAPLARGGMRKADETKLEQMLRQAQALLTNQGLSPEAAAQLVQPMEDVLQDGLRSLQGEKIVGLVYFGSTDVQKTYAVSHSTPELVAVDRHFDLRPLVDLLPLEDEFFVLAINKNQVILFQGSQDSFTPLFLPPGASPELSRRAAQNDLAPNPELDMRETMATNNLIGKLYSSVSEDRDWGNAQEYIQAVCRDLDQYLSDKKAPLIIATTDAMHPVVRKHLRYPHVAKEPILTPVAPDRSSAAELHPQAQKILERYHAEKKQEQIERYRNIAGTRFTAATIPDILQAARTGQIEVLLASSRRNVYGSFDPDSGRVEIHDQRQPADTELVSLAVQEALTHAARVYLVDDRELPQDCPMVAILRW